MNIKIDVNIPAVSELAEAMHVFSSAIAYHKKGSFVDMSSMVEEGKSGSTPLKEEDKSSKKETKEVKEEVKKESKQESEETTSKFTEEEVRAKFVATTKKGKKTEAKKILTDMGLKKISDLKPEHFDDVMAKLEAI